MKRKMKKYTLILCIISIIIIVTACAPVRKGLPLSKPESKVNNNTKIIANQTAKEPPAEAKDEISDEFKELLNKSKIRVKSISYKYRGPETTSIGFNIIEFYVKGAKVKYLPYRELRALDNLESYNSVYIDTAAKTAQSYCDDRTCIYKGKKGDLNYEDTYIPTVFDWLNGVTQAKKVGEEVIDDRNTWKIETNKGTFWIDTYYGIPLKIVCNDQVYRFEQIVVNGVRDSDVTPGS